MGLVSMFLFSDFISPSLYPDPRINVKEAKPHSKKRKKRNQVICCCKSLIGEINDTFTVHKDVLVNTKCETDID